jgi:hypothetical protein
MAVVGIVLREIDEAIDVEWAGTQTTRADAPVPLRSERSRSSSEPSAAPAQSWCGGFRDRYELADLQAF